jgi:hypothetical protein
VIGPVLAFAALALVWLPMPDEDDLDRRIRLGCALSLLLFASVI